MRFATRYVLAGAVAIGALLVSTSTTHAQRGPGQEATLASIKLTYDLVKGYITKSAEMVPQEKYSYQPTAQVRTMGQLFGHIANSTTMICAAASGMKAPASADAEKMTSKADIQKALASAFAFCDHTFTMVSAANANEPVDLFGMKHTRAGAFAFNNTHLFEHYGNLVTYLRMNGMVPPSSAGGGN